MPPFGAWERVKGKRVQIPYDLVTVIREPAARVHLHRSLSIAWEGGGRCCAFSQETCPLLVREHCSRSRGIGCT